MSIIGLSAILATFFLILIGMDRRCQAPFPVLLAIPLVQLGGLYAALAFVAARPFDTDTITYFYDVLGALSDSIKPGTSFIVYLTDALVRITGGSFDDIMAIYSISGILSSFLLLRYGAIAGYQGRLPILCSILILLPTFHFYTTAIGKDGLSALALTLIIIGATHFPSRMKTLGAGFVLLTLVRPHIAAFAAAALLLSQMIGSNNKTARLAVVPLIVISPVAAYFVFNSFLGINVFDLDQVSNFLGERNDALSSSNYVINSSDNIIIRIFGLLYFPLFFNADSIVTIFASLENIFLLFITVRITLAITKYKMHKNPDVIFLTTIFILLTLFMGITNYNIGLGLRLKSSMIFPIFMALLIVTEMRRLQETSQSTDQLDMITN